MPDPTSLPPTVYPVDVYAGDTLVFPTYTITDADDVPMNLSGWTFTAQWRHHPHAADAITLTVDTTDAASGVIGISATAAQTRAMKQSGVWDLEGVMGGTVRTFLAGTTVYTQDVSRA